MGTDLSEWIAHPAGEQPEVEEWSTVADTFAGHVHIEWDTTASVTPLGQLPFFIEYLKQGGLFDGWVADCPLLFTSPNAPRKRDVLGTLLLSVLAGHRRYAHVTALRCDAVLSAGVSISRRPGSAAVRRVHSVLNPLPMTLTSSASGQELQRLWCLLAERRAHVIQQIHADVVAAYHTLAAPASA